MACQPNKILGHLIPPVKPLPTASGLSLASRRSTGKQQAISKKPHALRNKCYFVGVVVVTGAVLVVGAVLVAGVMGLGIVSKCWRRSRI